MLLFVFKAGFSQIPQQLNYQGAVRDQTGKPVINHDVGVRLSIQDGAPNGPVYYTEERLITTNGVGLYTIAIGSPAALKSSGDFAQIPWGGSGLKSLKVEVDLNGGTNYVLAGITPLVSVPYALYSKYAENVPAGPAGKDGSTILSGPGDPQLGIGNPGDYYFNTTTHVLYGPQNADGTWPSGTVLLQGPAGPQGGAGADGLSAFEIWQQIPGNENKTITEYLNGLKGADGAPGINCWDTNGNGLNDPAEDSNSDGLFNTLDCAGSGSGNNVLTDGHILVGNAANIAQDVPLTGDAKITNTGVFTINDGAITLNKMADGAPDQIYITDGTGKPTLSSFNGIGWSLYGNNSTVDGTHFLGTTDDLPLNFRINNEKAGRITNLSRGETTYGYRAGANSTGAFFNTLIGSRAGEMLNSTSNFNTFIGASAGRQITINSFNNTAIGYLALIELSGPNHNNNVAIGRYAGRFMITGSRNVFIGEAAGISTQNGNGSGLTLIGNNASAISGISNSVAIGNVAEVTQSNSFVLGGTGINAVNVGIGTTAPSQKLHLKDGHIRSEQTISPNITLNVANGFTGVALLADATDIRGTISLRGTTLDIVNYSIIQYDFDIPSTNSPVVTITPANLAAAQSDYYVEPLPNGFLLYVKGRTAVITEPRYNYLLIE